MKRSLDFYDSFFVENLKNPQKFWYSLKTTFEYSNLLQNLPNLNYSQDRNSQNVYFSNSPSVSMFNSGSPARNTPSKSPSRLNFAPRQNGNIISNTNSDTILISNFILRQLKQLKLPQHSQPELLRILRDSDNHALAAVMSINADDVKIGLLNWEKIALDLWEDLSSIPFDDLAKVIVQGKLMHSLEYEDIRQEYSENSDRMAQLLCLVAQRSSDLVYLQEALYFMSTTKPQYLHIANKCSPVNAEEFEWIQWHRDIFIVRVRNLDQMVLQLHEIGILNKLDLQRFERLKAEEPDHLIRAKHVINAIQRKHGQTMISLIHACQQTENTDLASILHFQPQEIRIPWNAFQLLQFNWLDLIETIQYKHVMGYLVSRNFLPYREHLQIEAMTCNQEKMRYILKLLITRDEFYDAFFHILSLQSKYKTVFENSFPMSPEEQNIILEVQDFLVQHISATDKVCEGLALAKILTPSDLEYIDKMSSNLRKNLTLCNILKTKSTGTVPKFLSALWKAGDRNAAEILAVDFKNFDMSIEEWNKLKSNWESIVKNVNSELVLPTLLNTGLISEIEMNWIQRSVKNRHRMRKLLRILPAKKRGYKILLLALSQYDEYQELLLKCQPMELWQLKRIQENIEFLNFNTKNLKELIAELLRAGILTDNEAELVTTYEEPVEELYMLLMGKDNGVLEDLIKILQMTENYDAAAILNIDLFLIAMSPSEWKDFQRMWLDFIDEISYEDVREYFKATGLISRIEDSYISTEPDNDRRMRLLLQVAPYRQGALQALVQCALN